MLYEHSLTAAISLMIFFAGYLSFGQIPQNPLFTRYKKSCRIMAVALLLLALNYMVHDFINPRFHGYKNWAIWMNLCTYFCEVWLFYSSLVMLLDVAFEQKVWRHSLIYSVMSVFYIGLSGLALWWVTPEWEWVVLVSMCVVFVVCITYHGVHLSRHYKQAVNIFDTTHSDDISAYIHWMNIIVYWAIVFGTLCGLFTFLPDKYVWLWVVSSIPFYIYIFVSYHGYLLFYEEVETLLEDDQADPQREADNQVLSDDMNAVLSQKLERWMGERKYTEPGLTLAQMAREIGTNRTYLTNYIHQTYHVSFREWVNGLRINYAKQLLAGDQKLAINDIAIRTGYTSQSLFTRTFSANEGCTPTMWRRKGSLVEGPDPS